MYMYVYIFDVVACNYCCFKKVIWISMKRYIVKAEDIINRPTIHPLWYLINIPAYHTVNHYENQKGANVIAFVYNYTLLAFSWRYQSGPTHASISYSKSLVENQKGVKTPLPLYTITPFWLSADNINLHMHPWYSWRQSAVNALLVHPQQYSG